MIVELERVRGCLLGGAIGDALGSPVEFMSLRAIEERYGPDGIDEPPDPALITDDTQMTLFTAEGLIRAQVRFLDRGLCHPPSVVRNAYMRWLFTQDGGLPTGVEQEVLDGWLVEQRFLHARRAPGNTCLNALRELEPVENSKGCGGVMRVAPVGLIAQDPFALANECAAITHGHVTSSVAAGAFAVMIGKLLRGASREAAAHAALDRAKAEPGSHEVVEALERALGLPRRNPRAHVSSLGLGWIAEEALAIGVYAMLATESFTDAVVIAANHDGDSDSTASIAGNLVGTYLSASAIPIDWLRRLEAREVIEQIASDIVQVQGYSSLWPGLEATCPTAEFVHRYPAW